MAVERGLGERSIVAHDMHPPSAKAGSRMPLKMSGSRNGYDREFLGNRLVYAILSERAGGILIGVNMNPDAFCNFDCAYCDIPHRPHAAQRKVNLRTLSSELKELLESCKRGEIRDLPNFAHVPEELLNVKAIALSGEGEPSLCPNFGEVVSEILTIRRMRQFPKLKLVLITNGTGLSNPEVLAGIEQFHSEDEIWVKLDAGSSGFMQRVNGTSFPLEKVIANITLLAQKRPVIIQSLFCSLEGAVPEDAEIENYLRCLNMLVERGAQISRVQVYSVVRPPVHPGCTHLPLSHLSAIARRIRAATGLQAEVY